MIRRFGRGEMVFDIEHLPQGFNGRGCVEITLPALGGLKLRITLEDAETLGDALIAQVRAAEEKPE